MDDNFLYQLGEQPDPGFVERLRQRLVQDPADPAPRRAATWMRFASIGLLLAALLLTAMSISPVKAFVESLITRIAGQSFEITSDYPGDDHPGQEETIEPQLMSVDDALAAFPYRVKLPAEVPAGFVLDEEAVRVYVGEAAGPFANTVEFQWRTGRGAAFSLRVTDLDYASTREIVGPGSVEELALDENHPAVLIRGGWHAGEGAWRDDLQARLRWQDGNLYYELSGMDAAQLIEIARSILGQH